MAAINQTVKIIQAVGRAYRRKWSFLAAFLAVFFVTFSVLASADLVPDPVETVATAPVSVPSSALVAGVVAAAVPEDPIRVQIEKAGIDVTIKNPTSTDVAVLDQALLTGAVRYPQSAKLGEEGNVVLFGHSSYLPIVNNKSYKAFNEIQNLEKGDRITVYSEDTAYVYSVTEVAHADANADAIPLTKTGHTLTLATCDSFGKKTDRFVVVASLVESYPLAS